jgi:peroxiredoxin Q/BCP
MLTVGQKFPDFSLQDQDGNTHTLESLKGKAFVVYFYPKDDTPGCTTEACEFRDAQPQFEGVRVFGVSPDSVKSHKKFAEKFGLNFPLLADTDKHLAEACGVWVEKSMYGKTYMGVARTTFLVDANGLVQHVWEKVTPKAHAADVLSAAK